MNEEFNYVLFWHGDLGGGEGVEGVERRTIIINTDCKITLSEAV